MNILLVAAKKALTGEWLSQESPTVHGRMDVTTDTYKMENITAIVNHKLVQFTSCWEKWIHYMMPLYDMIIWCQTWVFSSL